jgi:excisionase family DNA binding protein
MSRDIPTPARWLSAEQAAEYLGVPISQIRTWRRAGLLRPSKPGGEKGRCFYQATDLDRFMEANKISTVVPGNKASRPPRRAQPRGGRP